MEIRLVFQEVGQSELDRCHDRERRELMNTPKLGRQRRGGDAIAHFPAGCVEGLAE